MKQLKKKKMKIITFAKIIYCENIVIMQKIQKKNVRKKMESQKITDNLTL